MEAKFLFKTKKKKVVLPDFFKLVKYFVWNKENVRRLFFYELFIRLSILHAF